MVARNASFGRHGDARRGLAGPSGLARARCGTMARVGSRIEAVIYDGAGRPAGCRGDSWSCRCRAA
jgi:hypothetical protein